MKTNSRLGGPHGGVQAALLASAIVLACALPYSAPQAQETRSAPAAPPARPARSAPVAEGASRAARRTPIVELVEKVSPAVVNISTEQRVENNPFRNDPFWGFFGGFPGMPGPGGQDGDGDGDGFVQNSLGSGVLVDPAGYILTNNHVISGA